MSEPARYVFDPLDRRGLIAGLRAGQVAILGAGLVLATALLRASPNGAGIGLALVAAAGATATAFVSVGGQTAEQWAPIISRRALRLVTGATVTRPASHRRPGAPNLPPVPKSLSAVSFLELADPGGTQVGAIRDGSQRTISAVLAVRGRSFALLDEDDKARRLTAWSAVLAGLAREDGHVRTLQWVERTVPGDAADLEKHLAARLAIAPDDPRVLSYRDLITEAGPLGQEHECFVVLSVRDRGRASEGVLLREMRLLRGQLRTADIEVEAALTAEGLRTALHRGFDPWGSSGRRAPTTCWPVASDESWSAVRTDDTWHATFWVAEWPRREVSPDFLGPLLLHAAGQRSVSLIMGPVPPSAGVREVESARTAQAADEALRQRAGFMATARRMREAEGAARREAELADGHAAYRFSGYVTVSARTADDLEEASGQMIQSAHQCRLEVRRLHAVQDVAITWTLPLGRGLAAR